MCTATQLELPRLPRVLSYGGGADSFAVLLRAIELGEAPDAVVFVDVSNGSPTTDPTDPGEWPGTYKHVRERVIPLCAAHGIRFEWLDTVRYPVRDARSLYAWLWARGFKMLRKPPSRPSALVLVDNRGRHYRAPPLDVYVQGTARPSAKPCTVCGAALRESKEVGCGWLDDAA